MNKELTKEEKINVIKNFDSDNESPNSYTIRALFYKFIECPNEARNEYLKAIELYSKAIDSESENPRLYHERGVCYNSTNNYNSAIDDFNKAIELYSKAIDSESGNPQLYHERGVCYYDLSKFNSAIDDFSKAIELNPLKDDYYYQRALCYFNKDEIDKAISDYTKAIDLNPKKVFYKSDLDRCYAQNSLEKGKIFESKKEYEQAIDCYTKAIDLDKDYAEAYEKRGDCYSCIGRHDKAIEDYSKTLEFLLDKKSFVFDLEEEASIYGKRADCYFGLKLYDHAIDDYISACIRDRQYSWDLENCIIEKDKLIKFENERKLDELKTNIFQAVSHTLSNIMLANRSIIKKIKNSKSTHNDIERLELMNNIVITTMKAIKIAFRKDSIDLIQSENELFFEKIQKGISLYHLLYFCLNINLHYLVTGEEGWETVRKIFFDLDDDELIRVCGTIRKAPGFSVNELTEKNVEEFIDTFHSDLLRSIHKFFSVDIESLRHIYVKEDSYTFAILFIILLELTKNMLRYGSIENETVRKYSIKSASEDQYQKIILSNIIGKSKLTLKESTLQGLAMIQEFAKALGRFEKIEKQIEDTDWLEFITILYIKTPTVRKGEENEKNSMG